MKEEWTYMFAFVAFLLIGFYFISAATVKSGSQINILQNGSVAPLDRNTISVSGSASSKLNPDMITVSFSVKTEDKSAKAAQADNADSVNQIIAQLKLLGVKEENIRTTSYSVDEKQESHYICKNESDRSDCYWTYTNVGFTVSHSVSVETYDMGKGGDVVDAIVAGNGKVDLIRFGLKPETMESAKKTLLNRASAAAKAKADAIAGGAGVSVMKPLSISESYSYYSPYNDYKSYAMEAAPAPSAGTTISAGTMEISADVSAVYEVK
jgi:uncharacterized protein YggE